MKRNRFFVKCVNHWRRLKRNLWISRLRSHNHNHDFSLITNNCVGGVISHDLGEQFRSPTVNLWFPDDCFPAFAQNLKYYLSCEIRETPDESLPYPVGTIIPKDEQHIPILVYFMHYSSFEQAYAKWKERSARVNYDRLYFIWEYQDESPSAQLEAFDRWDARKLIILHKPMQGIKNCAVTNCYNRNPYNGKILSVIEKTGKRYLDEIDFLNFLNDGSNKRL